MPGIKLGNLPPPGRPFLNPQQPNLHLSSIEAKASLPPPPPHLFGPALRALSPELSKEENVEGEQRRWASGKV
jgi:hypothetical protein